MLKLVRHHDFSDRETFGAAHRNSVVPKQRHAFLREKADTPSPILHGLNISGKKARKLGFNIARIATTYSCVLVPFKGILEET